MATAVTLKESDGSEIYPVTDISLVNNGIHAVDIEATTPAPAVETAMIADGAVTGAKLDFLSAAGTAVIKTVSDLSGARKAIYYADGTLIAVRRVTGSVAVTTAVGSLYHAAVPIGDYWALVPVGNDDFIETPIVQITPYGTATQYFWIGAYENSEPVRNPSTTGNRWALPKASVDILRATTHNNVNYAFHITAIGRWK